MGNAGYKTVSLKSLGCSKNLVDSEVMLGILKGSGMAIITDEREADVIIVNTCSFISDARAESVDAILTLAKNKKDGQCKRLIVTGCLSQRYKDELVKELPEVDCFIGTGEYHRIGEAIRPGFKEKALVGLPTYIHDHDTPRLLSFPSFSAYVKVAEGCSNHCSYCSIPLIRGEFRSRSTAGVVKEAANLAGQGVKEINLIAQDTTSYGKDRGEGLIPLLKRLVKIRGIEWIRLLYLYPGKITDDLISLIRDEEKVLAYFDVPLQHVNERILKAMNRQYTKKEVSRIIEKIRKEIDHAALRTSLITGFPGETEKEFEELLSFVEEARFDRLGVFTYSKEEGTPAFGLKKQVPAKVMAGRMAALMEVQRVISLEKNTALMGKTIKTLIQGSGRDAGYALKGRAWSQAPDVDGSVYIKTGDAPDGSIMDVKITKAEDYDLIGVAPPA